LLEQQPLPPFSFEAGFCIIEHLIPTPDPGVARYSGCCPQQEPGVQSFAPAVLPQHLISSLAGFPTELGRKGAEINFFRSSLPQLVHLTLFSCPGNSKVSNVFPQLLHLYSKIGISIILLLDNYQKTQINFDAGLKNPPLISNCNPLQFKNYRTIRIRTGPGGNFAVFNPGKTASVE
jgi:hypothetical protein